MIEHNLKQVPEEVPILEKKIFNFVWTLKYPIVNQWLHNHYIFAYTLDEANEIFSKGNNKYFLIDVIEIPKEKWNCLQIVDRYNIKWNYRTLSTFALRHKNPKTICKKIQFVENYMCDFRYTYATEDAKKLGRCLSEICPVKKEINENSKTRIGSFNCCECINQREYNSKNKTVYCLKLNEHLKSEELKKYKR